MLFRSTEQVYFTVPEAQAADISRAVGAAREAFDSGPWPGLTHEQRADYLRAIGAELKRRSEDIGQIWPRESGVLHAVARGGGIGAERTFSAFAALASTYPFEEPAKPTVGQFGLLVREPATRAPRCTHRLLLLCRGQEYSRNSVVVAFERRGVALLPVRRHAGLILGPAPGSPCGLSETFGPKPHVTAAGGPPCANPPGRIRARP